MILISNAFAKSEPTPTCFTRFVIGNFAVVSPGALPVTTEVSTVS